MSEGSKMMGYQALYRKWRPRTFTDVVGQSHITRTLQNALEQKQFSHAYLFSGPRGTGKTSLAKIFAQTVNCEQAPTREPCLTCHACCGILDGSIPDVIEIDAASNTSVEDVREIRDKVKYATSSVPYKVYIIDEVHMISTSAFNALLKTLEEPPAHVIFILATTEPHRIPLTIISRCQRFDFKPIGSKVIVDRMKTIVEAENVNIEDEALETIALTAEGGMRDALSILDQAISYSNDNVRLHDVLAVTGGVAQYTLTDIVTAMHNRDVQTALNLLDDLIQNGKDPSRFIFDLIYFLRDILLYKSSPTLTQLLERAIVDDDFKTLAKVISTDWVQATIDVLNDCQQEIKWTTSPKILIEIAMLTICNSNRGRQKTLENHEMVQSLENKVAKLEQEVQTLKQATQNVQATKSQPEKRKAPQKQGRRSFQISLDQIKQVLDKAEKEALQEVRTNWGQFLEQLKALNAPAHATIQDSKPVAASDQAIVVAFRYEIHCSLFLDHRKTVESVLAKHIHNQKQILPIPEQKWQKVRSDYVAKQEHKSTQQTETENGLVEAAKKLVGEDLVEIHHE